MANDERNYYVICDDNCRFEGMTKEQIIAAIAEATGETPVHIDDAFITKIKEQNAQQAIKVWKGTEAQYNALQTKEANTLYVIDTNEIRSVGYIKNYKICELATNAWTQDGVYFKQSVACQHFYDEHPAWTPCNSDGTGIPASEDALKLVYAVKQNNNLTFYAKEKPSNKLYVLVKGVD